jgi:hypothetical protein
MKTERWVFTQDELERIVAHIDGNQPMPSLERGDEFIAVLTDYDIGVIVYRDGEVSNRWADGTAGLTNRAKELAEDEECFHRVSDEIGWELAAIWLDVQTDSRGRLVAVIDEDFVLAKYRRILDASMSSTAKTA